MQCSAGQVVTFRSYTRDSNGVELSPGLAAVGATMTWEFSRIPELEEGDLVKPAPYSFPTYEIANMAYFVVGTPSGNIADGVEGEPGIWEPSIDGEEGYNLVVTLPKEIQYSPVPPATEDFFAELVQGFYRLVVEFEVSGSSVKQEFWISSRN